MAEIRVFREPYAVTAAQISEIRKPLLLDRLILDDTQESRTVQQIITAVRHRGDDAVSEITAQVDQAAVPPGDVRVPEHQIRQAYESMPAALRKAVHHAIDAVWAFQEHIMPKEVAPMTVNGRTLGVQARPLRRVGICVPGAAAPLLSSVIHSGVPAQVAGVKELVVVAPPRYHATNDSGADIDPTILGVAGALNITEVYRMGGAHAMAALALGTQRVPRVDKIVGPGGVYVQLAKRYLYGIVDIDMFAATTEVLIIADETANPKYLAADMLAQAEHNPGCSILLTTDDTLPDRVGAELMKQLQTLSTAASAAKWLAEYGAMAVLPNMDDIIKLANEIAPEHLQIETKEPRPIADQIESAGAIFLGHYSPEAAGDYVAGPSHVLPTGGTGRFWSGVSCLSFLRYTSLTEYTREGLAADSEAIDQLGRAEHLEAHAKSATLRVEEE
jgi:histidinol dehydrogenase